MATRCLNVVGSKGMQYGKVLKIHNIAILLHKYLGVQNTFSCKSADERTVYCEW